MQLSEEIQFDEKISKYFQGGVNEVQESDDWDYVVNSYFLKGELVYQDQLLADKISRELEGLEETLDPMDGDLKQDLPVSQAFSDVGEEHKKLGKPFNEKSDTGDDLSRTGPGGNAGKDDYDAVHYEGQSTTKLNAATGIELMPDAKQIYDIDGTVPELQENIKITIEITEDESQEEKPLELQDHDLMNHEGRKDPGTHTNTIKAGEKRIDKLEPISDIWKSKNDGMNEAKTFSFIGTPVDVPEIDENFEHPSSWIGTVTWNPETLEATVVMNGKVYNHSGVGGRDFESFRGAPSKGAHWNRFWKGQFNSTNYSEALHMDQRESFEFDWINDDAIEEMMKYAKQHGTGKFILAVVSGDSVTDHRAEGIDEHQRHWSRDELVQNIRTGKGKMTNINHLWPKADPESGGVYDANWNFKTDRGEMILWETDQDILAAIRNDIITAVSINTGNPRHIHTNCDDDGECFLTPMGTILGETDGVALAFVVTDPDGFNYNGQLIPAFPPGMKFTKLYIVE